MVRRGRLIDQLAASAEARAICLQAPGGYGKSTVLAQWLNEDSRPVVWLTVRPEAADAGWLARALTDALAQTGLLSSPTTLPLGTDAITWSAGVLPAIERDLESIAEPCVVVIDDAGELNGMAWESVLESMVRYLPQGSQLALATRSEVPRPLRRLRSGGVLLTIGPDSLAFDPVEGAELMRLLGVHASDATLLTALEQTEGWPVAFYLSALAIGASPGGRLPRRNLARDQALADYMRDEILDRLSPQDADFMLRASVLTYLDEQGCDVVTDSHASLARLRRLAAGNHLIIPLDRQASRFRMHALLAQFLSDEFRTNDPTTWRAAHAAASEVREAAGDLDAAAHHAKLAGDDHRLGALMWRYAGRVLASSESASLRRWLDGVSEMRISSVCDLALCAAWLASHEGDMVRMERMAVTAEALSLRAAPERAGYVGLLKAVIGSDGVAQIESAGEVFATGRDPDDPWLTLAHFLQGVALVLRGQNEPGLQALDRGYRLARALGLHVMQSHCLAAQADVWLAQGEPNHALPLLREARAIVAQHRLDLIATSAPVFTTSAACYLVEGRPADARREGMRALRQTARMHSIAPWYAVQGRVTLAEVFHALGDHDRARSLLDEAVLLRGPATQSPVLDAALDGARHRVTQVASPSWDAGVLTAAEVRVLQYLPTHLSFPAMALELAVSPHTVKSQAMSAYRKLGAHTRDEAIRRAREVGLLPEP